MIKFFGALTFTIFCLSFVLGCGIKFTKEREAEEQRNRAAQYQMERINRLEARLVNNKPKFCGKVSKKPINFNLVGNWKVMRFGTKERPMRLGSWEFRWCLTESAENNWLNNDGDYGDISLIFASNAMPQMLRWHHGGINTWFSINKHSFGYLEMTGDDGEQYAAVRTEGGETNKKGK